MLENDAFNITVAPPKDQCVNIWDLNNDMASMLERAFSNTILMKIMLFWLKFLKS